MKRAITVLTELPLLYKQPNKDSELCIALASALHYVRLCVFSWMLLMTHNMYMQYKTGLHLVPITDTNISRNFISSCGINVSKISLYNNCDIIRISQCFLKIPAL
ncbi:hypothetical protein HUJ05_003748 [Dendroctonus ponderosae]|nr:hypothetical protein HUJ05_003748 [Dendroctonus ponderosae]